MPETNALPTDDQLLLVRADLDGKLPDNTTLDDWLNEGLTRVKRDLEDERDVRWSQVYDLTNDQYFDNEDATGRNRDRIQSMILLATSMLVFQQYANRQGEGSEWWEFYLSYKDEYTNRLSGARLDIDENDDGEIDEHEEGELGQSFFSK